ncbi:unnamed protein product [Caenorhabditis bovis]|uniref:Uncharacterized protein n=1 Tax=Caenorhabditis bovis TaxID=2654633 RepID=A0A8S1EFF6_9PELO|nr:unnamed protein product [Caenorhabditis bovis]
MDLIDKTVELRGSQVLNMNSYKAIVYQRRFMAFATLLAWIGVVMLIVALATTHWATIDFQNSDFDQVQVDLGVWGEWRTKTNTRGQTIVEWIPHFPSPPEHVLRLSHTSLKHYYRSQAAMGVISMILLLSTNLLAIYTFYHHRYMFKRVVACLYIVIAMVIYATIEILSNSIDEWDLRKRQDETDYETEKKMGYSTRLAQCVIGICVFAAFCFAIGSHKQKGDAAATAELEIEDREYHIGR